MDWNPPQKPRWEYGEADLAWLAGLLEGEGWFGHVQPPSLPAGEPRIVLQMTDRDVVMRAARLLGEFRRFAGRYNNELVIRCRQAQGVV